MPHPLTFDLAIVQRPLTLKSFLAALMAAGAMAAHAGPVDSLKAFVRDVKSGRTSFTQTVTAPDGVKKKTSSGDFEFSRPNRFRFAYTKPFEQVIVADGQKVWIFDKDLNQASSRQFSSALGATPAALLAGGSLEKDFELSALPDQDGLSWAQAVPKAKEGGFNAVKVGFRGNQLAAIEILDSFGQRSLLQFGSFDTNASLPPERFRFVPPPGADVIEQ